MTTATETRPTSLRGRIEARRDERKPEQPVAEWMRRRAEGRLPAKDLSGWNR